jgi:hypothetical protein
MPQISGFVKQIKGHFYGAVRIFIDGSKRWYDLVSDTARLDQPNAIQDAELMISDLKREDIDA